MPFTMNLGLSKKVGLPDYGSLGASCHVELEIDGESLSHDPKQFHEQARAVYAACSRAIEDELARQLSTQATPSVVRDPARNGLSNGHEASGRLTGGQPASAKQLAYIDQLAGQIKGLGSSQLAGLARRLSGKTVAELSSLEASSLIDALKDIKAGKIDLAAALGRAAA